jgi:hypothetical protein
LTDGGYPSPGTWTHTVNWDEVYYESARGVGKKSLEKMKNEGLYFQMINSNKYGADNQSSFYFTPERIYQEVFITPVFIFGNKNRILNNYIDSLSIQTGKYNEFIGNMARDKKLLKYLRERNPNLPPQRPRGEIFLNYFGGEANNNERPLRWCHAELALVPTKKSLNVLFFEAEDEK